MRDLHNRDEDAIGKLAAHYAVPLVSMRASPQEDSLDPASSKEDDAAPEQDDVPGQDGWRKDGWREAVVGKHLLRRAASAKTTRELAASPSAAAAAASASTDATAAGGLAKAKAKAEERNNRQGKETERKEKEKVRVKARAKARVKVSQVPTARGVPRLWRRN